MADAAIVKKKRDRAVEFTWIDTWLRKGRTPLAILSALTALSIVGGVLTVQNVAGAWLLWITMPVGILSIISLFMLAFCMSHEHPGAARMTFLSSILLPFVTMLFIPQQGPGGIPDVPDKSTVRAEIIFEPDADGNPQELPPGKTRIDLKEVDIADRTTYLENGKSDFSFRDIPASFKKLRFEIQFAGYHSIQRSIERPHDASHPAQIIIKQSELKPVAVRTITGTVLVEGAPWTAGGTVKSPSAPWESAQIGEGDSSGGFFTLRRVSVTSDEIDFIITLREGKDSRVYRKSVSVGKVASPDEDIPVKLELSPSDRVGKSAASAGNVLKGTWEGNLNLNARQVFRFGLQTEQINGSNIHGRIRHGAKEFTCDTAFDAEICDYEKSDLGDKAKWEHAGYAVGKPKQSLVKIRVGQTLAGRASPVLRGVLFLVITGDTATGWFPDDVGHAKVSLSRTGN